MDQLEKEHFTVNMTGVEITRRAFLRAGAAVTDTVGEYGRARV